MHASYSTTISDQCIHHFGHAYHTLIKMLKTACGHSKANIKQVLGDFLLIFLAVMCVA